MVVPTIQEIKTRILDQRSQYDGLNTLNSTSKVALFNLWAFIVAVVIWSLYRFHLIYRDETDAKIRAQKIYGEEWYRSLALAYRHGHPLVRVLIPGTTNSFTLEYSDENYTEQEIIDAQIVKRAAVVPLDINKRIVLFIKCAAEDNGELVKLSDEQKQGVVAYYEKLVPSGTKYEVFSDEPDDLKLTVDFYYDPLVLTDAGTRIDGSSSSPVQDAIRQYLKELDFNGEFSIAELEKILRSVPGCSNNEAYVETAESNFQTPENFQPVNDTVIANSGYMSITDANLTINFEAKTTSG